MPTLKQYRQALAASEDLGGYIPFTSTALSSTTSEVVCSALIDNTTNVSSKYANAWLLGTSGARLGEQRMIQQYGFDGSTGTISVTRPFGAAPASALDWELYFRIPAIRDENGVEGYREIINTALSRMSTTGFISLTATTDVTRYTLDLSTYPFLRERGRILGLYATPADTTERREVEPGYWKTWLNNETMELQIHSTYATGTTFDIEVLRPANSRLKISGSWANQASPLAGMVADTDEAIPPVNDVVAVAMELCYLQLAKRGPESETRLWQAKAQDAGRTAAAYKFDAALNADDPISPILMSGNVDYSVWR